MTTPIRGISSMATRLVLQELTQHYQQRTGVPVEIVSVGGVDAAKRIRAGEPFDVAILAAEALSQLTESNLIDKASCVDLFRSETVVAIGAQAAALDISSEAAVRDAVRHASSVSYSTGPSGAALAQLLERWGLTEELQDKIIVPPPGVPVGTLVARGEVQIGFQQRSELMHLDGIQVLGALPAPIQITTTFTAGVCTVSQQQKSVLVLLDYLASSETADVKRRYGMEPA